MAATFLSRGGKELDCSPLCKVVFSPIIQMTPHLMVATVQKVLVKIAESEPWVQTFVT